MVHNQTNASRNGKTHHVPLPLQYCWRMVPWFIIKRACIETETISDPSRECFLMFPWSKWLAQTTFKVKMERNRSAHRMPRENELSMDSPAMCMQNSNSGELAKIILRD